MRFEGRARGAGAILGKGFRRNMCFGIPSGLHTSGACLLPESDPSRLPQTIEPGGFAPWTPARGKEVTTHGVSVRARRKPLLTRFPAVFLRRLAERRYLGMKYQEPPRSTRRVHSPLSHAPPLLGAPA